MTAPKNEIIQMRYQNPHANKPLFVPVLVINNTPDHIIERNIRINSTRDFPWLRSHPSHSGIAIMVGGGPSVNENLHDIRSLQNEGGTIFAMNAASQWLRQHGIEPDYQCIVDAKQETIALVDPDTSHHLIGSQVHPDLLTQIPDPILMHLEIGEIEHFLPEEKVKRGGYVLLGGGASVGNTALCAAYALGFRNLQIFGYDSCHRDNKSHAYPQDMNIFIPTVTVKWNNKEYLASVAMKAQAERFMYVSSGLKKLGCHIDVHGEGLLPAMYHSEVQELSEREKYQLMWQFDSYRESSPGERVVDFYLKEFRPKGLVIDFGCGTGRASLIIHKHNPVMLLDFVDNCRDEEAQSLPFIQWDLTDPIPVSANYGFCSDVLEHIPEQDVAKVIANIMQSAIHVFFQISVVDDVMGDPINQSLHVTIKPHSWWKKKFLSQGYKIVYEQELKTVSHFYVNSSLWREYGNAS